MSLDIDMGVAVLSDYDEDNHLQIQTDSPGADGSGGTQGAEALSPNGVHSRPNDPDAGGGDGVVGLGEGVLIITIGSLRYALPIGDPRDVIEGRIPKSKKGGKILAGGAGTYRSFVQIDGEDPAGAKKPGSIMISASYNKAGSKKSLGLSFNVRDEGAEDISLVHGDGARVTVDKTGTTITAPNGKHYLQVSDDGIVLAGSVKVQGSITSGEQTAAKPLASGPEVVAALTAFIGVLSSAVGVAPGAPLIPAAASLSSTLATIPLKHTKGT